MVYVINDLGRELSQNDKISLEVVNKYRILGCIPDELYHRIIEYLRDRQFH